MSMSNGTESFANTGLYYTLGSGSVESVPIHPASMRRTVAEALGLPRLVSLELGYNRDPEQVREAISKSELAGKVVWSQKDKKVYLAFANWLSRFGIEFDELDDKAKSVIVEVLKKEVHPAFNNLGRLRLKPAHFKKLDGIVLILKDFRPAAQIAVAWETEGGVIAAKGTCVAHDGYWLDCPEVPLGYDGWLNVSELSLNGVKLGNDSQFEDMELENLTHFWVSLQTDLNVYRSHVSPSIAGLWRLEARRQWVDKLENQMTSVVKAKVQSETPQDVAKALGKLVRPYGHMSDFLDLSEQVGAFPEGTLPIVEALFSMGLFILVSEGPMNLMAFGYHFPSARLKPGEIVVPPDVLERAGLMKKFKKHGHVMLECWRNPVLPGLDDDGKSPSAGAFKVVGISYDQNVYISYEDAEAEQSDFDGDRQSMSLDRPYGLLGLSYETIPVKKNKTSRPVKEGDILDRKLGGLGAYVGQGYNLSMNVEDQLFSKGVNGSVGAFGWTAVQSALVAHKHIAEAVINGVEYSTQPNPGQHCLSWATIRAALQYRATELGVSTKPTSALEAYRWLRKAGKHLTTMTTVINKLPTNAQGIMAAPLRIAQFSTRVEMNKLTCCSEQAFRDYVMGALRSRKQELAAGCVMDFQVDGKKVKALLSQLLLSQQRATKEGIPNVDNDKGMYSFYIGWSDLMRGAEPYHRIHNMIRILLSLPQDSSIWLLLRVLGADYQVVRAIGKDSHLPFGEVWQPSAIKLWERQGDETDDSEQFAGFMSELGL